MPDHLLTPTPTEADLNPTPDGSNTKRRPGIPITPACSSSKSGTIPPKPQRSPSFILRQTVKSLLPVGSFKSSVKGYETSLSKFFNARIVRTSSLPLDDVSGVDALSHEVDRSLTTSASGKTVHIYRSQSLPMNMTKFNGKSFKRMDSLGGMFRIVPATPRVEAASNAVTDIAPTESGEYCAIYSVKFYYSLLNWAIVDEDVGEDIPEEEAVCRICMVEPSEGSDTLKLECSCKGELALAHKDCAVKWFSIKGTRDCEVCKQEVQTSRSLCYVFNLKVCKVRQIGLTTVATDRDTVGTRQGQVKAQSLSHNKLVVELQFPGDEMNASSCCRRCTETLGELPNPFVVGARRSCAAVVVSLGLGLAARNGIAALAISLPFSGILGLFSSLTTTSMVARRYVWIYAAIQFLFVVFVTHLFYKFLHLQAVISIILATFAGFGVGMTGNSIIVEILRWRVRRVAPPSPSDARRNRRRRTTQQQAPAPSPDQTSTQPSAANGGQSNAGASDVENPAVPQG
ncbi:hypothetical protein PR202_gb27337 [Eleusine coracana subsp. coracana]|uniref:RING-CH-type domain-containing protein n=1 Tax=Eleusine coracana subsp. coracana TaxID=191504 RepID=A0AAV5FRD7_ELECO|nr:hypothetical protein PR202_gb27337 [Eleusine coracana subsp. coracana]